MKFGNIVRVETSRYLTKITTLQRKADRKFARSKVLAAKHTASLQLLYTVGGDLASPRTVAKICFCQRGTNPKKNIISLQYAGSRAIVANAHAWLQELYFWQTPRPAFLRSVVIFVKYREVSTHTILLNFVGH